MENRESLESYYFDPSKCCRKPRSNLSRRASRRGFFTEISSCKDASFCTLTAEAHEASAEFLCIRKEETGFHMARCSISTAEPSISSSAESTEVESLDKVASVDSIKRRFGQHPNLHAHSLSHVQSRQIPLVKDDGEIWLAPGSVVWAKFESKPWWPAKIMDEKKALLFANDQSSDGLVLVQLYGSHEYAWINPVTGLSRFDCCYKERSTNPLKAFQDALQQALDTMECTSSGQQSDKCDISSSSRTNEEDIRERRGKRKHMPKVHFDELIVPEKSVRKTRRMKIMRDLGLAAPVGSPFSVPRARHA